MNADLIAVLVKYAVMFAVFINVAPIMVWVERRGAGLIQDRPGPNRVGPFGLFQPLADALKFMFKEDVTPTLVDKPLYLLAPVLALMPAFTTLVLIPFGPEITAVNVSGLPGSSLLTKCSHFTVRSLFDHGTSTWRFSM